MSEPYEQSQPTPDGGYATSGYPHHTMDADGDGKPDYTPDVASDAKDRALRTFAQGLMSTVVVAMCVIIVQTFGTAHSFDDVDWSALAFLLVQTLLVTGLSYVMRYLQPPAQG